MKTYQTRGSQVRAAPSTLTILQFRNRLEKSTLPTVNMGAELSASAQMTKAQKKNAAKKRAKQASAAQPADGELVCARRLSCAAEQNQKASQNSSEPAAEPAPASALSKEEKELRKITKKLREIEKLQSSVDEVPNCLRESSLFRGRALSLQTRRNWRSLQSMQRCRHRWLTWRNCWQPPSYNRSV